ncbi:DUF6283 family protein [Nonomuraea sp. NPDC003560]|uniref:DUF6283 family protein n=1 Tax=Nonomuraea sp. NPDC003560 TaxID=3364341 RepID=UPI00368371DF
MGQVATGLSTPAERAGVSAEQRRLHPPAARAGGPCPFLRDAPLGAFTPEQFDVMRVPCRSEHGHAELDAPLFRCHPGEPATGDDLACAGWLAVEDRNSLRVGLAIAFDRLPDTVLDPRPGWPALYNSFEEMVEANRRAAKDE